jgi:hypothetical protein
VIRWWECASRAWVDRAGAILETEHAIAARGGSVPCSCFSARCARCGAAMHPAQNSRRLAVGIVCMGCHEFEMSEPRFLREPPRDDPRVN